MRWITVCAPGLPTDYSVPEALLGNPRLRPTVGLQSGLQHLAEVHPLADRQDYDYLEQHTFLPLYRAFLPPARGQQLRADLLAGRRCFATLFDEYGRILLDSIQRDQIMNAIRCGRDEPVAPPSHYPDDDAFDRWLDTARATWAHEHQLAANEINIICAMALLGSPL